MGFTVTHEVIASQGAERKDLDTLMYTFLLVSVSRRGALEVVRFALLAAALCKQEARLSAFSSACRWLTKGPRVLALWICGGLIMRDLGVVCQRHINAFFKPRCLLVFEKNGSCVQKVECVVPQPLFPLFPHPHPFPIDFPVSRLS